MTEHLDINQDDASGSQFVTDVDTLAALERPNLSKLRNRVEQINTRLIRALAGEGDATDARKQLRQAQQQYDEAVALDRQIVAAREHVHQRDHAQAEAQEAKQHAATLRTLAGRLETQATALEQAESDVLSVCRESRRPLGRVGALSNGQPQLFNALAELERAITGPDEPQFNGRTPAGSPAWLRSEARKLRNIADQADGGGADGSA